MTTPLHAKIMTLLDETQRLAKHEAARKVEEFINSHMDLKQLPHYLSISDLSAIKLHAINNFQELDSRTFKVEGRLIAKDDEMARTVCYVSAITGVLAKLGLLNAVIKFK